MMLDEQVRTLVAARSVVLDEETRLACQDWVGRRSQAAVVAFEATLAKDERKPFWFLVLHAIDWGTAMDLFRQAFLPRLAETMEEAVLAANEEQQESLNARSRQLCADRNLFESVKHDLLRQVREQGEQIVSLSRETWRLQQDLAEANARLGSVENAYAEEREDWRERAVQAAALFGVVLAAGWPAPATDQQEEPDGPYDERSAGYEED